MAGGAAQLRRCAGMHGPAVLAPHQGEGILGEIRGNAGIDPLDLAGPALKGGVQLAAQQGHVAAADQCCSLAALGEIVQVAIAPGQLLDQHGLLLHDPVRLPPAAIVQLLQLGRRPAPLQHHFLQQLTLPGAVGAGGSAAQGLADLEVETASHQFQPVELSPGQQILFQPAVDHDVGVQLVDVQPVAVDGFLVEVAQGANVGVFAGVDFGQQELQGGLVGRVDGLVQLPDARADELSGGNPLDAAKVEGLLGVHIALVGQGGGVVLVVALFGGGHQPPDGNASRQQQTGAIELVQQQIVLAAAAVLGSDPGLTAAVELPALHQKAVQILAQLPAAPLAEGVRLLLQQLALGRGQLGGVADPQVQIGALGLPQRAGGANQEQRLEGRLGQGPVAVDKAAGQLAHPAEVLAVGGIAGHSRRAEPGGVAGQHGVVAVKQQGQQVEQQAAARAETASSTLQPLRIDLQKAPPEGGQNLAVQALVDGRSHGQMIDQGFQYR